MAPLPIIIDDHEVVLHLSTDARRPTKHRNQLHEPNSMKTEKKAFFVLGVFVRHTSPRSIIGLLAKPITQLITLSIRTSPRNFLLYIPLAGSRHIQGMCRNIGCEVGSGVR